MGVCGTIVSDGYIVYLAVNTVFEYIVMTIIRTKRDE